MIVINLPAAPGVVLPPETQSMAYTPSPEKPDPARRLSRRVQSLAVARLSRDTTPSRASSPAAVAANDDNLKVLKYDVPADTNIPPFANSSKDVDRDLARLYEAVSGARRIAVICGAGISVSSPANIPDFRSAHGLFKKLKEKHPTAGLSSGKDLFDARLFSSEGTSSLFYSMVAELKRLADEAEPTIFHRLLKRLDEEGRLQRVYTQNIDGLEEKAGLTFGLGETGDAASTVRALGKRKRFGGDTGNGWSRSKSDSHVLFAQKQEFSTNPMFPRTIPLHGTLQTLTCALCSHKVVLGNTVHRDRVATASSSAAVALGYEESVEAMQTLQKGEAVPCPACETADEVRTSAGMRSRGVGRMKVDIVLYNGQNDGAERVGQCLQRDILGLRDPFEPSVPESAAEMRARERKEKKALQQATSALSAVSEVTSDADSVTNLMVKEEETKDDILARAFANDDDAVLPSITVDAPPPPPPAAKKPTRPPRLKPLPPDLLIVAGTSLKVPGTKRIVREFAKACHAHDEWLIYSSEDESSASETTGGARRSRRANGKPPSAPAATTEEGEHEIHDLNTPIRSILLNYDFPMPAREWEDVFDVWIQGDLQRAALSLFPASKGEQQNEAVTRVVEQHTWSKHQAHLAEQRRLAKKKPAKTLDVSSNRKGSLGRTVSAAAKMERSNSSTSVSSSASSVFRGKSESPMKKKASTLKRSNSSVKKSPFPTSEGKDQDGDLRKERSPSSLPTAPCAHTVLLEHTNLSTTLRRSTSFKHLVALN